jgi:hypothetical protein
LLADTIVTLFQFKVAYQLSDLTYEIKGKLAMVVVVVLDLDKSNVVLRYSEVDMNRRDSVQKGVLVTVSIRNFLGSLNSLLWRITEDQINLFMTDQGLKSVQIVSIGSTPTQTSTTLSESVAENSSGVLAAVV